MQWQIGTESPTFREHHNTIKKDRMLVKDALILIVD
jgi:hypothetical protein